MKPWTIDRILGAMGILLAVVTVVRWARNGFEV